MKALLFPIVILFGLVSLGAGCASQAGSQAPSDDENGWEHVRTIREGSLDENPHWEKRSRKP